MQAQQAAEERSTEEYYERNAKSYAEATLEVDVSGLYGHFLQYLPSNAHILDAGSGSGRDTLAFIKRGYSVDAFDASPALCDFSSQLTGVRTHVLRFQQFDSPPIYDGVWACASLLHVPAGELEGVVARLIRSLKSGGALYMSFKHGTRERHLDNGRLFTDMDKQRLDQLFSKLPDMKIAEIWTWPLDDIRQDKGEWLNVIAIKNKLY